MLLIVCKPGPPTVLARKLALLLLVPQSRLRSLRAAHRPQLSSSVVQTIACLTPTRLYLCCMTTCIDDVALWCYHNQHALLCRCTLGRATAAPDLRFCSRSLKYPSTQRRSSESLLAAGHVSSQVSCDDAHTTLTLGAQQTATTQSAVADVRTHIQT